MKIEQYLNDNGEFRCFGFSNAFFHKSDVKNFVESLPDSEIVYFTKAFGAEDFCEFIYKGEKFTVSEPYGDNSFYDIFCENPDTAQLRDIYNRFCDIAENREAGSQNKFMRAIWVTAIVLVVAFLLATIS